MGFPVSPSKNTLVSGKPDRKVRLSTVHLLVLTRLDQLFFILKILFAFVTKQPTLMRRSTVMSLPGKLVFPARVGMSARRECQS